MNSKNLKFIVQKKYADIARSSDLNQKASCCGTSGCCGSNEFNMIGDDYKDVDGYNPDADLGLGCGLPVQYTDIKTGDSVLDLGCGAGNDCFVARSYTGPTGKVTGLDFTEEMIEKAKRNNLKMGFENINFVLGDIEEMPIPSDQFDVVISNCVLNLVPNKRRAFSQIFRVLNSGGHFCISDVVTDGELSDSLKNDAQMYVGCVSGAIDKNEYLNIISECGFKNVVIHKLAVIDLPSEIIQKHSHSQAIYSITLSASKN